MTTPAHPRTASAGAVATVQSTAPCCAPALRGSAPLYMVTTAHGDIRDARVFRAKDRFNARQVARRLGRGITGLYLLTEIH